jgi:hypothetical protein
MKSVGVAAAVSLTACESAAVNEPNPPGDTLCSSADCVAFRALGPTGLAPTFTNATRVARTLRNTSLGTQLADRVTSIQSDVSAGRTAEARATATQVVTLIDSAIGNAANAADWPDLSVIRINLEPVLVFVRAK